MRIAGGAALRHNSVFKISFLGITRALLVTDVVAEHVLRMLLTLAPDRLIPFARESNTVCCADYPVIVTGCLSLVQRCLSFSAKSGDIMRHSLKIAALAAAASTMVLAGQAMATVLTLAAPYDAFFTWNNNGTVTYLGAGGGTYTGVQQQSELWNDFTGTDLPAGTIMELSLTSVGGHDEHSISFLFSPGGAGSSYTLDYVVSDAGTPNASEGDASGAILQTAGSSTLGKSFDTNTGPYAMSFTQVGPNVVAGGITDVAFLPGTTTVGVTDNFTVLTGGSNATGISNSFVENAIPEPSTWAMMVIGFVGLGYAAFRRSSKARAMAV
jgi:hypothetical protein